MSTGHTEKGESMGVTIRQIAEAAGVSRGTVDRALNNRGRIKPEVAEEIKRIAKEMGYRPNQFGRALSMSKNNIKIGVILQGAETPFMQTVLQGIEQAKEEVDHLGGTVLLTKIPHISAKGVLETMEKMREDGVSAIAMAPVEDEEVKSKINEYVEEYQIPVVTFNSDVKDTKRLCFVGQNAYQCGRAAAGLMGELVAGEGKVAMISGYSSNPSLSNRIRGFQSEMEKKYPKVELLGPEYCFEDNMIAGQLTEKVLTANPDLKGIFMNSHGEEGMCKVLEDLGRAGEIKVVANDFMGRNYEFLRDGTISLLIGQDAYVQGYEPVMILFRLLFHGEEPQGEFKYTDIMIRNAYTIPQ